MGQTPRRRHGILIDICIMSYNRPEYFAQLLNSLNQQHPGEYAIGNVHLFQDGPKDTRRDEDTARIAQCIDLFRTAFPDGHVTAAAVNVGINGNYSQLWECLAQSGADAGIVFEDDLVLSPHYLNVMAKLLAWAEDDPNVGMVSAVGALGAPVSLQQERRFALVPMGTVWGLHRWGWGMTQDCIREFLPVKRMYFDLARRAGFADNEDSTDDDQPKRLMIKFINHMAAFQGPAHMEIDTLYDAIALNLCRVNLTTYASFARSVGKRGVHFTPELFTAMGHHRAEMMETVPETFAWYEPQMMLDVLSLIRRFYSNYSMNYNSGAFACEVPYPDLVPIHATRFLYERIFGWSLTLPDYHVHNIVACRESDEKLRPGDDIMEILLKDYDDSYGLLATGHRKNRDYAFPYAIGHGP